ncbi:MAG: sugar phosphorylase [Chloroflexi bacterium]|nr:sugar phosphorylase [Chloroflexota bacterium]
MSRILDHLIALYGDAVGRATFARLQSLITNYRSLIPPRPARALTARDAILITYGDQVREPGAPPLLTLADFCARHLAGLVSGIHILPFYPYTSDDGFSVTDYRAVNPALGNWDDVARVRGGEHEARPYFRLMFDAVVNHISSQSAWFRGFLRDDPRYRDYFIVVPDGVDVSAVVRPRTSPLLTRLDTPSGPRQVWTTFSADQIDLNYRNPAVLLEIIELLLSYIAHGAEWLRLDAVAFLWKEFGTPCLHLPQTHRVIQLMRAALDEVAPGVMLITETNVPHADNVAYFGDGTNEAHLVYNFALPPLTLHAIHTGNAMTLARWARGLTLPSKQVTFFNFLASHDGIGLNPARGILSDAEIDALVKRTLRHGGLVSQKQNPDGTSSAYELNINYFDALSNPNARESLQTQIDRFVAAHAIMFALIGVPGIYFHSLFGSRSWPAGVAQTGQKRTINREKLYRAALERDLSDTTSRRHRVFARLAPLVRARGAHPAFDPLGGIQVLDTNPSIFAALRGDSAHDAVICLHNVSNQPQTAALDALSGDLVDLITGQEFHATGTAQLAPYQSLWLARKTRLGISSIS